MEHNVKWCSVWATWEIIPAFAWRVLRTSNKNSANLYRGIPVEIRNFHFQNASVTSSANAINCGDYLFGRLKW